jgi:Zn-dependent peptidase ImmA (M78 family)
MEILGIMQDEVSKEISQKWGVPQKIINQYSSFYADTIRPIIKTNYLSHLVATVENMVNERRMVKVLNSVDVIENVDVVHLRGFFASKTFRLYSIILEPVDLKRRATTRYHPSGAIIYYNSCYEEKTKRILIAHEIGHIVNKELLENTVDTEQTANLFAYIAMHDKNKFYLEECKRFTSKSDIQILNEIINICPV